MSQLGEGTGIVKGKETLVTSPRIKLASDTQPVPRKAYSPAWCSNRLESIYERDEDWLEKPQVEVFITQPAYSCICLHAQSDLQNEVGGALTGKWCQDAISGSQFIVVDAALPARHTRYGSAFLTFTSDSLLAFQRELETNHPGKLIVGWYHTHPGMGVFMSGYDTWLHEHFFPEHYQVALVIEPRSAQAGVFIRQPDGYLDARRYYGLYELNGSHTASIIDWQNLIPREDPDE
ncbi:MAG: Mov34/MPN/PAD-1 family protein [Anaerolineaceae bacterium]|nr:Mov34/MPN/PAD-1 family protein [Anaerolineaceae bacterium]MBN2677926.1 Mov34/MPN/PAD-1 family protein [Anaerolineaceae bacterium]